MKISVIIPIYNAAAFLKDTLYDIANQTLKEIEIICVDDGSTDSSREIVKSFMQEDSRIQLICQQNLFCGAARNTGMAQASGEYLCFWDADDRFEPDALELMYRKARETDADICLCGVNDFDHETGITIPRTKYLNVKKAGTKQPFNRYDIPEHIFNFTTNQVWNKMFLRSFIEKHQLTFGTEDFVEDTMFVLPALYYAERICYVDKKLIRYRCFNPTSAVGKTSSHKTKYYKSLYDFYHFMKATGEFEQFKSCVLSRCLGSSIVSLELNTDYDEFCSDYYDMRETFFHDLELADVDQSLIQTPNSLAKMQTILHKDPGTYLLNLQKTQKRDMLLQIQEQKSQKKTSQKKLARANKKITELESVIASQKKELELLSKQLQCSNEKASALANSRSYRIGRKITFPFRKIKQYF